MRYFWTKVDLRQLKLGKVKLGVVDWASWRCCTLFHKEKKKPRNYCIYWFTLPAAPLLA